MPMVLIQKAMPEEKLVIVPDAFLTRQPLGYIKRNYCRVLYIHILKKVIVLYHHKAGGLGQIY